MRHQNAFAADYRDYFTVSGHLAGSITVDSTGYISDTPGNNDYTRLVVDYP
jgi:hypothetical protein